MNVLLPIACLLGSAYCLAAAENQTEREIDPATKGRFAIAGAAGKSGQLLLHDTAAGTLQGFLFPEAPPSPLFIPRPDNAPAEFPAILGGEQSAMLKVEWLGNEIPAKWISQTLAKNDDLVSTYYRAGMTTISRTVLARPEDGVVFIHLHADQPGILSFKVSVSTPQAHEVRVEDRRQLILSPEAPAGGFRSHVWVLPFESDVATEGTSITVRGEGEALIVWTFAKPDTPAATLAETLPKLGKLHDPGHIPPDPSKIWHAVLENHAKSAKNSP